MSNKEVRSVAFHKIKDQKILEFIENQNFSGYVKELISLDIERRNRALQIVKKTDKGGIKIVLGR
ncbi:hypothetical protein [Neobacillus niacini]|uniref:hypothetical protein n=1 Tax=Neobacillus niacini TaxID=86668 RepID=UPI0021CB4D05|nr:hypothetical protein [Neobacillus niacini]MCM3763423.1 hypothetical protein [Neobacillus niacini]